MMLVETETPWAVSKASRIFSRWSRSALPSLKLCEVSRWFGPRYLIALREVFPNVDVELKVDLTVSRARNWCRGRWIFAC